VLLNHRYPRLALAAIALALGTPVAAEVTRSTDISFVSRHEVVVKADAKAVWLALITPADWWSKDHTWSGDSANLMLTPQAGGCFCETIPEVDEPGRFTLQGSVEHMRVVQAYPEAALRMVGALGPLQSEPVTGVLTIVISKVDKGTRIVWEYNVGGPMRYDVPVISKAVDGVMGVQLAALTKLLGGAVPMPAPVITPTAPVLDLSVQEPVAETPSAVAPKAAPSSALTPAPKPATAPAPKLPVKPTVEPATKPAAPTPEPKPAPKQTPKTPSVEDAFSDLEDGPAR
jgi:cell division septation protein DedD